MWVCLLSHTHKQPEDNRAIRVGYTSYLHIVLCFNPTHTTPKCFLCGFLRQFSASFSIQVPYFTPFNLQFCKAQKCSKCICAAVMSFKRANGEVSSQKWNKNSLFWKSLTNIFSPSLWDMTRKPQQRGLQRSPVCVCVLVSPQSGINYLHQKLNRITHADEWICINVCILSLFSRRNNRQPKGSSAHVRKRTPFNAAFPPDVETVDAMGTHCKHRSLPPSAASSNMCQTCTNERMCRMRRRKDRNVAGFTPDDTFEWFFHSLPASHEMF